MLLEVKNLTKKFGGLMALSNLSLDVEEEKITALVGPNGSGKTTLFNVISGIYPPTTGSVIFDGKDITGLKSHKIAKLGIGRTFQIPKPYSNLTVTGNVASSVLFGGSEINDLVAARKEAMLFLELVGLEKKKNVMAGRLLAPEKKFLGIARALAIKPKLLMVDECFGGLNEAEVKKGADVIFRIRDELGITVFMIEHVMSAVMKISEKVVVIHYGKKIAEGKPKDVVENSEVKEAYLGGYYS